MINVVNLVQHYGVRPVLRGINLQVDSGELVVLMGPNGMGKSTLLAAIAGMLTPQVGYIEIDGKRRKSSVEAEREIRKLIYYLPDQPWLPLTQTGRNYLLAIGELYEIGFDRRFEHIDQLLGVFDLSKHGDSLIGSYSTGQQKKIAVCGALISEAPVLIMDEPFSGGLDPAALLALKQILLKLRAGDHFTILLATPVPELVDEIADRIAVLRDGEIIAYDSPVALVQQSGGESLEHVLQTLLDPESVGLLGIYLKSRER
ncbi:MAG: ABC transporter ATP-binding protein [Candidatus Hydrogenedentes bacterium]|nr:ABC transporter ATP-binding protein [Candidatus Hydrogenedentota bacterium]